jgi:hypothetical protein
MPLPITDDVAYRLLRDLWQGGLPDALAGGSLQLTDQWLTEAAQAFADANKHVEKVAIESAGGRLKVRITAVTPLGSVQGAMAVVPEVVRIDAEVRRVELHIVEPLKVEGGGFMSMMAPMIDAFLPKAVGKIPGATLANDRFVFDLTQNPKAEKACMKDWLGKPVCHFIQVVGLTVGEGGVVAHLRTGLDAKA